MPDNIKNLIPGSEIYSVSSSCGITNTYLVIGSDVRMWNSFDCAWESCETTAGMLRRGIPSLDFITTKIH